MNTGTPVTAAVLLMVVYVVLGVTGNCFIRLFRDEDVLVAPPCFYSGPEQTHQTPALERVLHVFMFSAATIQEVTVRYVQLVAICNLTTGC